MISTAPAFMAGAFLPMKTVFIQAPAYFHPLIERFKMHPFEGCGNDRFRLTETGVVLDGLIYHNADNVLGRATESSPYGIVVDFHNEKYLPIGSTAKKIYKNRIGPVCFYTDVYEDGMSYQTFLTRIKQIYLDAQ